MSAGSALSHGTSANLLDDNAAAAAAADAGSAATKIQRTIRSTTSLPHLSAAAASSHLQAVSRSSRAGPSVRWRALAQSPAYNRSPTVVEAENRRHGMRHGGKNGDDDDDDDDAVR